MKIQSAELEKVIGITSEIPINNIPEAAFCGRSNVGKSSLINSLLKRKSLARTSSKPGKTQTINFYNLNKEIYIVDLPGYGYANAPKSETQKWGEMIERYLAGSDMLRAIFQLCDLRHEASKQDIQMYEWIKYLGFQSIVIATKSDKIKPARMDKQISILKKSLGADSDTIIIPYSSETGDGRDTVLDFLSQIIENEN